MEISKLSKNNEILSLRFEIKQKLKKAKKKEKEEKKKKQEEEQEKKKQSQAQDAQVVSRPPVHQGEAFLFFVSSLC